jgi:Zn-dependent protease
VKEFAAVFPLVCLREPLNNQAAGALPGAEVLREGPEPMLMDPDATSFDLNFHVFGVPVRVSPWFWLVTMFLGWGAIELGGLQFVALWIACVFVSILIHELGHVAAFRVYGVASRVVLFGFGGLAIPTHEPPRRSDRILVALAGPAAQLVLYFLVLLVARSLESREADEPLPLAARFVLGQMLFINLYWPLLNLTPIWPLDGGRVSREVLTGLAPNQGLVWSLYVSIGAAAFLAINAYLGSQGRPIVDFLPRSTYAAIFFALFAVQSFQILQIEQSRRNRWDDDDWR